MAVGCLGKFQTGDVKSCRAFARLKGVRAVSNAPDAPALRKRHRLRLDVVCKMPNSEKRPQLKKHMIRNPLNIARRMPEPCGGDFVREQGRDLFTFSPKGSICK